MKKLFAIFDSIETLEPELRKYLREYTKKVAFKKGEVILYAGDVAKYIYFLEDGMIRSFETFGRKERTMYFMRGGDLFLSVNSFFFQEKAVETIIALTPCTCYRLSWKKLQEAYKKFRQFNYHRAVILEKYYAYSEQRNRMRLQSQAYKYKFLMMYEPWVMELMSDELVASYLGVSERSFRNYKSKLRGL